MRLLDAGTLAMLGAWSLMNTALSLLAQAAVEETLVGDPLAALVKISVSAALLWSSSFLVDKKFPGSQRMEARNERDHP